MNYFGLSILVLSPTPTWPLNFGNRKRIHSVCQRLKDQGASVHFVHYASEEDWRHTFNESAYQAMCANWDVVENVWPSIPLHDAPKNSLSHEIDEWWDPSLDNHLKQLLSKKKFDLVIVNYTWLSKAFSLVPEGALKVLDTHDKFSGRKNLLVNNNIAPEFFYTNEENEAIALNRADVVWAIKDEEKEYFEGISECDNIFTMLHMDERAERILKLDREELRFGFIGARNNINKTNVEAFISHALPIFEKYLPPIKFVIAGSVCEDISQIESPYLEYRGPVKDVDEFYSDVDVIVVPMEFSTGLKIKTAEALAKGLPVVSHSQAFEGFSPKHPFHSLNSMDEIALAIVDMSYDRSIAAELAEKSADVYSQAETAIGKALQDTLAVSMIYSKALIVVTNSYLQDGTILNSVLRSKLEWLDWQGIGCDIFVLGPVVGSTSIRTKSVSEKDIKKVVRSGRYRVLIDFCGLSEKDTFTVSSVTFSILREKICVNGDVYALGCFPGHPKSLYFPQIGHIDPKWFRGSVKTGTWLLGSSRRVKNRTLSSVFGELNAISISIESDQEMFEFESKQITRLQCPEMVVVAETSAELSYFEQLVLEFLLKRGVGVIEFGKTFDASKLLFGSEGGNSLNSKKYDESFFEMWASLEIKKLSCQEV